MGKKYPAGMGMVVAKISIQNCREVVPTWQELEAAQRAMDKRGWELLGERMPRLEPAAAFDSGDEETKP